MHPLPVLQPQLAIVRLSIELVLRRRVENATASAGTTSATASGAEAAQQTSQKPSLLAWTKAAS